MISGVHWYTVRTKPRAERQVEAALTRKGLDGRFAMVKVARVNPRARPIAPLFPGYLFVQADLEQVGQLAINWAVGVASLVSFGGEPAVVPETVIQHIQSRVVEVQQSGTFRPGRLHKGDHVRIATGPLRDLDAVFDQPLSAKGRARVPIEFLGRRHRRRG